MSMKTCVIGANNTGIKEIIDQGSTGLVFKTGDHEDLAKVIELILTNQPLRDELANKGFLKFKEKYELKHATTATYEYLKSLLC